MRRHYCWKTCLFVLLVLHNHPVSSSGSSAEEVDEANEASATTTRRHSKAKGHHDGDEEKALEGPHDEKEKQVEDPRVATTVSAVLRARWKEMMQLEFYSKHNMDLLAAVLPRSWRRRGYRQLRSHAWIYLENDKRRARAFALDPSSDGDNMLSKMMVAVETARQPSSREQYDPFEGMVLQVDFTSRGSLWQTSQHSLGLGGEATRFEIPLCRDLETAEAVVLAIDTYQLLKPLHLELGIASKHTLDFAYTPVQMVDHVNHPYQRQSEHHRHFYMTTSSSTEKENPKALVDRSEHNNIPSHSSGPPPTSHSSWWKWWFPFAQTNNFWQQEHDEYKMGDSAFAGGSHGEVWRGQRLCRHEDSETCREQPSLILKRLKVAHGYRLLEAGLREVYVGKLLAEADDGAAAGLFTKYQNHFFREIPKQGSRYGSGEETDLELWIVFEDAGPSLRSYIYSPVSAGEFVVYQHSYFWTLLRRSAANMKGRNRTQHMDPEDASVATLDAVLQEGHEFVAFGAPAEAGPEDQDTVNTTVNGKTVIREVLRQVLTSAAYLHEHGIVHRDIKPSNVMCKTNLKASTLDLRYDQNEGELFIKCVLGDFSSIWDSYTDDNMYTNGPSLAELTIEYAPPEAVLGSPWDSFHKQKPQSYDSWSIGVLALELLLGTPNVFSVDQRTSTILTRQMEKQGAGPKEIERALYLAALSQFCIYLPSSDPSKSSWPLRHGDPLYRIAMVKQSCTIHDFHRALRARDPLGMGFDNSTDPLLHLIWKLLEWDPAKRITAAEALSHPYFTNYTADDSNDHLVAGSHNALESQMLDPRMDFNASDTVPEFICPHCGRTFADWKSCHLHANARRHAKFCTYDRSQLPTCLNAHSLLPAHPNSGYCDIQGRRPGIEDFHSIHLLPSLQFYGVFDGHTGNLASKFAASMLYEELTNRLANLENEIKEHPESWKERIETNITEAFVTLHEQFLKAVTFAGHGAMDDSGTTATSVLVTDQAVVVTSIGDSRAILSSAKPQQRPKDEVVLAMSAIQLTKDHVASDPEERALVESLGGTVSVVNGLSRVGGVLAISRSIGDASLAPVMSRMPHIVAMTREEVTEQCTSSDGVAGSKVPCFIVLASDGLWDVISNQEAVDVVSQTIASYQNNATKRSGNSWQDGGAFQEASEVLTLEAYVRGSTDNIGVCVIALD